MNASQYPPHIVFAEPLGILILLHYKEILVNTARECGRMPHVNLYIDLAILSDSEYDGYRINIGSIRK